MKRAVRETVCRALCMQGSQWPGNYLMKICQLLGEAMEKYFFQSAQNFGHYVTLRVKIKRTKHAYLGKISRLFLTASLGTHRTFLSDENEENTDEIRVKMMYRLYI